MEPLVVWLLIFVVFFCVLYFIVKAACGTGYWRPGRPSKTRPTRKRMAKCHPFSLYPRGPAPFKTPGEQGR